MTSTVLRAQCLGTKGEAPYSLEPPFWLEVGAEERHKQASKLNAMRGYKDFM